MLNKIDELLQSNKLYEALKLLEEISIEDVKKEDLGQYYFLFGKYCSNSVVHKYKEKTKEYFNKAIEFGENSLWARKAMNNLGNVLKREGKIDESINLFKQAAGPDYYLPYFNIVIAYYKKAKEKLLSNNIIEFEDLNNIVVYANMVLNNRLSFTEKQYDEVNNIYKETKKNIHRLLEKSNEPEEDIEKDVSDSYFNDSGDRHGDSEYRTYPKFHKSVDKKGNKFMWSSTSEGNSIMDPDITDF